MQDNWTLSAWIQPDRLSDDQQILAYPQKSTAAGFGFGTHGAGLRFSAFGRATYDSTDITLKTGVWQHVAMRLSNGDLTFYVDGVAREVITDTVLLEPNLVETDSVYVGVTTAAGASTPAQLFQGGIDEVLLFNRALTLDEILALGARKHAGVAGLDLAVTSVAPGSPLYNAPMPQGTQLYLPFDDTQDASGGVQFLDISGQGQSSSCSEPACPSVGHTGHAGGAALFDGQNDYVDVTLDVSETNYGLALWFKTECAGCGIFSVDAGVLGSDHDRDVYLNGGNVCARLYNDEVICTSGTGYADGRWHHVVHTFGGTEGGQKLYLDGALAASGAKAASDLGWLDGINIGFSKDGSLDYFCRAVRRGDRLQPGVAGGRGQRPVPGHGPVLHLPLDERWAADGDRTADTSGWEHHGTLFTGAGDAANKAVPGQAGSYALQLRRGERLYPDPGLCDPGLCPRSGLCRGPVGQGRHPGGHDQRRQRYRRKVGREQRLSLRHPLHAGQRNHSRRTVRWQPQSQCRLQCGDQRRKVPSRGFRQTGWEPLPVHRCCAGGIGTGYDHRRYDESTLRCTSAGGAIPTTPSRAWWTICASTRAPCPPRRCKR